MKILKYVWIFIFALCFTSANFAYSEATKSEKSHQKSTHKTKVLRPVGEFGGLPANVPYEINQGGY